MSLVYQYKTEIENRLPFKSEIINCKDERFISKKIAGLLDSQYRYGKIPVADDLIDTKLVELVTKYLG